MKRLLALAILASMLSACHRNPGQPLGAIAPELVKCESDPSGYCSDFKRKGD